MELTHEEFLDLAKKEFGNKVIIAVEYVKWLVEERAKINRIPLEEIHFYENGMEVAISTEARLHWENTGLNNIDFITSEYYLRKPNQ